MAAKPAWITGWTGQHVRHAATMIRRGGNPAARVYESIGADFFLAVAPGWLNLGLWEGPGSEDEAEDACRRLVRTVASELPASGVVVDVGNGLGTQDPLIAETVGPRRLVAVNITEWQLAAGRDRLREAAAAPVVGDAARLPIADGTVDGSSAWRRRSISGHGELFVTSATGCCGPAACSVPPTSPSSGGRLARPSCSPA